MTWQNTSTVYAEKHNANAGDGGSSWGFPNGKSLKHRDTSEGKYGLHGDSAVVVVVVFVVVVVLVVVSQW